MTGDSIINTNSTGAKWRFVAFLLFIALIFEIYFLIYDIPIFNFHLKDASSTGNQAPIIAQLMTKKNKVRLQANGDLVWEDAKNNQDIRRQDSILTQENSKAEIAFLDGLGLTIEENSLVQIERSDSNKDQKIILHLLHGALRKTTSRVSQPTKPSAPPQKIDIQVGEVFARVTPESELTVKTHPENPNLAQISVQKGDVSVQTPQGKMNIKSGELASITSSSPGHPLNISTKPLSFDLIAPFEGDTFEFLNERNLTLKFRWRMNGNINGGESLELEVSRGPDFKTDLHQKRIRVKESSSESIETQMALPTSEKPVEWYWRVRSTTLKNSPVSEVSKFWIWPKRQNAKNASLPILKAGYQSLIAPTKPPPPPSKLYQPEILPRRKIRK